MVLAGPLCPRTRGYHDSLRSKGQAPSLLIYASGKSCGQRLLAEFLIHGGDSLAQMAPVEAMGGCQIIEPPVQR